MKKIVSQEIKLYDPVFINEYPYLTNAVDYFPRITILNKIQGTFNAFKYYRKEIFKYIKLLWSLSNR